MTLENDDSEFIGKCKHRFYRIPENNNIIVCDSWNCNDVIGTRVHHLYKGARHPIIIYPYLRRWCKDEIEELR